MELSDSRKTLEQVHISEGSMVPILGRYEIYPYSTTSSRARHTYSDTKVTYHWNIDEFQCSIPPMLQ